MTTGWIYDAEPPHTCILPGRTELGSHFEGSIWRCGICDTSYEVRFDAIKRQKVLQKIDEKETSYVFVQELLRELAE